MITLRDYQQELIDSARVTLKRHKQIILQLSTGGGKTACASFMISGAVGKGKRTIFAVPKISLLHQTSRTLNDVEIDHGFIWANAEYDPEKLCHIASIDTLHRRLDKVEKPDFLVIDECHHATTKSWQKILEWASGGYIIGLSATPTRTNGESFRSSFEEIVCGKSMRWLIDSGYLSDYKLYAPPVVDRKKLHIKHGDYNVLEVEEQVLKDGLVGNPVRHWQKYAEGMRTLVFAPTIKTSEEIVKWFGAAGVPAAHMDADTPIEERTRLINMFADGKLLVLSNVGLMTEGFDLSATVGRDVPVEAVIIYTVTRSLSKYLQIVGRALRPKENPAIILDHGANWTQHGMPDAEHAWTLDGVIKPPEVKIKQCKRCFHCYIGVGKCPACGYSAEPKARKPVSAQEGDLVEVIAKEEAACKTLKDWHNLAKKLGRKPGWAWVRYNARIRSSEDNLGDS